MTIDEMKKRKRELGYSYQQLSELSGVPVGTLSKVLNGGSKSPRFATLNAIEKALSPRAGGNIPIFNTGRKAAEENVGNNALREPSSYYGNASVQKNETFHTREELDALPESDRKELIDGIFYDMAAPSTRHQRALLALARQFADQIDTHACGDCEIMIAPLDVVIDCDNSTVVQPDLVVICQSKHIRPDAVYGAPDLTLEILSPSTKMKDQFIKLNKYRTSGVKEYWIVDPDKFTVTVYNLAVMRGEQGAQGDEITIYGFDDEIPVWISSGKCSINMKPIKQRLQELEAL